MLTLAAGAAIFAASLQAQPPQERVPKNGNSAKIEKAPSKPVKETIPPENWGEPGEEIVTEEPIETDSEKVLASIRGFFDALQKFDISKAYYAYTTKQFRKAVTLDDFKIFVKKYSVLGRNKSFISGNPLFKENLATVQTKLTSADSKVQNAELQLIQEDAEWKILAIHLLKTPLKKKPPNSLSKNIRPPGQK